MSSLVVLGAGPIGAAVAHQSAAAGLAARVVLVDDAADVARGLALDIRQSGAVAGAVAQVEGGNDVGAVVGAGLIVVADRHGPAGEWRDDAGLALVGRVRTLNPRALIVCAGGQQFGLVETLVHERGAEPLRIVASAPEAMRTALTALVGLASGAAADDIGLGVFGRPPDQLFVAWEGASIGGSRAADVLPAPVVARLDRQLPFLWPPGPLSLAAGAVRVARIVTRRLPGWVSVGIVPPGEGEGPRRAVALPATQHDGGVRVHWPVLAPREQVRLESAGAG